MMKKLFILLLTLYVCTLSASASEPLPSEQYRQTAEPGKKPSIQQAVKGRAQRIREEQTEKRQQPRTEKKQDMEL